MLLCGLYGVVVMILSLIKKKKCSLFTGYPYAYPLDPGVVFPITTHMDYVCTRLETVARDIFNQAPWRLSKRSQDA